MPSIREVRQALADAASACGTQIYPNDPDQPTSGSGWVYRREFDPRMVFGDTTTAYQMGIAVVFNRNGGLAPLDDICEPSGVGSLRAAVENGDNWGVTVDYAQVTRVSEVNVVDLGGVQYLSVEFDIEVVW